MYLNGISNPIFLCNCHLGQNTKYNIGHQHLWSVHITLPELCSLVGFQYCAPVLIQHWCNAAWTVRFSQISELGTNVSTTFLQHWILVEKQCWYNFPTKLSGFQNKVVSMFGSIYKWTLKFVGANVPKTTSPMLSQHYHNDGTLPGSTKQSLPGPGQWPAAYSALMIDLDLLTTITL